MLATTTVHEEISVKIIAAIEKGQTPPWRKPWRPGLENSGFPCNLHCQPFTGVNTLLLNMASISNEFGSRFWATKSTWVGAVGGQIFGNGTMIVRNGNEFSLLTVYNADEVLGGETDRFRSRRRKPVEVDYGPADELIASCRKTGAEIVEVWEPKAEYHYPPADRIIFPFRELFVGGPGGLPGYYDSLFHELAHMTEPRLGFKGDYPTCELRSEIAAPFLASQVGIPVLSEMQRIPNHRRYLPEWVAAMNADPTLIFNVAADASEAVDYLLSLTKDGRD